MNDEFHGGTFLRTTAMIQMMRKRTGAHYDGKMGAPSREVMPPLAPDAPTTDPLEWLDRMRPVAVKPPSLPRATLAATTGLTIAAGDLHFPQHDERSCAVFIETCAKLKPSRVILNGDLPDMLAVSKYPTDARRRFNWTLQDEAAAMHGFLRELEAAVPRDCAIVETEANHSGNGTASRWWRYLSDRAPALMAFPQAEEKLSYQAWWYPEWSRIRLVESVVIADDLLVIHGDIVRKHAAYSARATMEKWASSVMHSHTHRLGMGHQNIPALPNRDAGVLKFYEIGCLCRLDPSYASAPNWSNGFAIIREDGERYGVELVGIVNGAAVVTTLGQTVRAA